MSYLRSAGIFFISFDQLFLIKSWSWSKSSISQWWYVYSLKANDWLCMKNLESCERAGERAHTPVQYIHGNCSTPVSIQSSEKVANLLWFDTCITLHMLSAWHRTHRMDVTTFCLRFIERASVEFVMLFWSEFQFFSLLLLSNSMHIAHNQSIFATRIEMKHKKMTSMTTTAMNSNELAFSRETLHCIRLARMKRKIYTLRMRRYNSNKVNMEMYVMHFGIAHRLFRYKCMHADQKKRKTVQINESSGRKCTDGNEVDITHWDKEKMSWFGIGMPLAYTTPFVHSVQIPKQITHTLARSFSPWVNKWKMLICKFIRNAYTFLSSISEFILHKGFFLSIYLLLRFVTMMVISISRYVYGPNDDNDFIAFIFEDKEKLKYSNDKVLTKYFNAVFNGKFESQYHSCTWNERNIMHTQLHMQLAICILYSVPFVNSQ